MMIFFFFRFRIIDLCIYCKDNIAKVELKAKQALIFSFYFII